MGLNMWRTNTETKRRFRIFGGRRHDPQEEARQHLYETAHRAVIHGSQYLNRTGANGFTILHDDATGSIYDIDRPQDLVTLHNVLPREDLFIIAKDNNKELLDAIATAQTTPWSLVQEFGSSPGYRVTTTGGYRDPSGQLFIDHGMMIATTKDDAVGLGKRWNQQSVLELDNRGDVLKVDFHNVV